MLVVFAGAFFYAVDFNGLNTPQKTGPKESTQESVWIVEYEAQHDHVRNNSVNVTYAIPSAGGAAQEEIGRLEMEKNKGLWTKTQQFEPGSFLFLTVKNNSYVGGVTCRIRVNGVVIAENSSKGRYVTVTCTNQ